MDAHNTVTLFKEAANNRLMAKCRQLGSTARSLDVSELQHLLRLAAERPAEAAELPLPHPPDLFSSLKAKLLVPWCLQA